MVLDLSIFPSFQSMFAAFPFHEYGSRSAEEYTQMYEVYSPEKEKEFGVLAIRIQCLSEVK